MADILRKRVSEGECGRGGPGGMVAVSLESPKWTPVMESVGEAGPVFRYRVQPGTLRHAISIGCDKTIMRTDVSITWITRIRLSILFWCNVHRQLTGRWY